MDKGLRRFFETGKTVQIPPQLAARCKRRLDILHHAIDLAELNVAGFNFHPLKGHRPTRYSIHVSGPWTVTFEWIAPDAYRVALEQYH